jgi:lysophospholipase L1-like esterase
MKSVGCSYTYLALGDSATVGLGAPPGQGYASLIAHTLSKRPRSVCFSRVSGNGWRSVDLAVALNINPNRDKMISQTDLITLFIGGNDLLFAYVLFLFSGSYTVLDRAIDRFSSTHHRLLLLLRSRSNSPIYTFNLYNPFPQDALARTYVSRLNREIERNAASLNVPVIDLARLFSGKEREWIEGYRNGRLSDLPLIGRKPIHPNAAGHRAIFEAFWTRFASSGSH